MSFSGGRLWRLGRHYLACNLYTGARSASTGLITWTSAGALLNNGTYPGSLEAVRWGEDIRMDEIMSVDDVDVHNEEYLGDSSLQIGEIQKRGGTGLSDILPAIRQLARSNADSNFVLAQIIRVHEGTAGASIDYGVTPTVLTYPANTEMIVFTGKARTTSDGAAGFGKGTNELTLVQANLDSSYRPLTLFNT